MQYIAFTLLTLRDKLVNADKERGATAVEYGLLIGLVSIALIVALIAVGPGLGGVMAAITTWLGTAAGTVGATT